MTWASGRGTITTALLHGNVASTNELTRIDDSEDGSIAIGITWPAPISSLFSVVDMLSMKVEEEPRKSLIPSIILRAGASQ